MSPAKVASWLLWQRVAGYLATYGPLVVTVAGGPARHFTSEAIVAALRTDHTVRLARANQPTRGALARAILGIEGDRHEWHWLRWLSRSFVKELREPEPQAIVVELPCPAPGELDWFSQHVPSHIMVITDVPSVRLDLFGDREGVAHEMASLVTTVPKQGRVVLNADDPVCDALATHARAHVVRCRTRDIADVWGEQVRRKPDGVGFFLTVRVWERTHELHLPHLIALPQVTAILAALAVAESHMGRVSPAIPPLQTLTTAAGTPRLLPGRNGATIIDDAVDATPESTLAALDVLRALPGQRKIAVLGDIDGLGSESHAWHRRLGSVAASIARIVAAVGYEMRNAGAEALRTGGVDVHHFDTSRDVGKWFAGYLQGGDVVLVCGGAGMKMGEVITRLAAARPP